MEDVEIVWERSERLMRRGDWFDDCVVWGGFWTFCECVMALEG